MVNVSCAKIYGSTKTISKQQRRQDVLYSAFYQKGWFFGMPLAIWPETSVRPKQRWSHSEGCCQISES